MPDTNMRSPVALTGVVTVEKRNETGQLVASCTVSNLVTSVGDQVYASRGAGLATSAAPTGMKLGTGGTAVAKTGAGAALVGYLSGSNDSFDTAPTVTGGVATYKVTYAAGQATTASPVTEVVIVNDAIATNATSAAAATVSRALLTGIGSKGALDSIIVTWSHTVLGS